jgi:hypothetical protein
MSAVSRVNGLVCRVKRIRHRLGHDKHIALRGVIRLIRQQGPNVRHLSVHLVDVHDGACFDFLCAGAPAVPVDIESDYRFFAFYFQFI